MGRKITLTETQLLKTIRKIVREEDMRWSGSPYDLEGHHIIGFDNRYDADGNYKLYWGDIGNGEELVTNEVFTALLNTWLDPKPERFCTVEEFKSRYPKIKNRLWKDHEDWMGRNYINEYGCILVWDSKYGKLNDTTN
jgi:hypothetical protein